MGGKTKTSFDKDSQPKKRRGKSVRTRLIEALERKGVTEEGFYDLLVERALSPDDNFAMKELIGRVAPLKKAVMPDVEFEFDHNASAAKQASMIIDAASSGKVPPDVATMLIGAIKNASDIEINTEIKQRLENLEAMLNERIS